MFMKRSLMARRKLFVSMMSDVFVLRMQQFAFLGSSGSSFSNLQSKDTADGNETRGLDGEWSACAHASRAFPFRNQGLPAHEG
jgi:hypothetical protein